MEQTNISHHRYGEGILVEVISDNGDGDVSVLSVEFDLENSEEQAISPRSELPEEYEDSIHTHIENAGYIVAASEA